MDLVKERFVKVILYLGSTCRMGMTLCFLYKLAIPESSVIPATIQSDELFKVSFTTTLPAQPHTQVVVLILLL